MPRPEYKTITVKVAAFKEFIRLKKISGLQNSEFLESLYENKSTFAKPTPKKIKRSGRK